MRELPSQKRSILEQMPPASDYWSFVLLALIAFTIHGFVTGKLWILDRKIDYQSLRQKIDLHGTEWDDGSEPPFPNYLPDW